MNDAETEFLALAALGMFTIDPHGRIWRHTRWTGGSHNGSKPTIRRLAVKRYADVSLSGIGHGQTQYRRVMFLGRTKRMKVQAHRVAWMMFKGLPIPCGLQINHSDGDGLNNRDSNLLLATNQENVMHSIRVLGRKRKSQPGEQNPSSKLSDKQVAQIKHLAKLKSMPQWRIAELFNVSQVTISNIHLGKTWAHIVPIGSL